MNDKVYNYSQSLQQKCKFYNDILTLKSEGYSFLKIARIYKVSEKRIRTLYYDAVKIKEWETNHLWRVIADYTKDYPSSYAIRMYGILTENNVCTIKKLKKISLNDLKNIKGIGIKYFDTLQQIKSNINIYMSIV